MAEAAGCTFYALLSLFPGITAIVSIYGLFADRSNIEDISIALRHSCRAAASKSYETKVHRLAQTPASGLSAGAIVGLLTALWSANAGTKAMFSALNDVYGEREERGFLRVTATSLPSRQAVSCSCSGAWRLLFVVFPLVFGAMGLTAHSL